MAAPAELTAARWRRLDGPGRLPGIDLARGLAVVGMLAAHLVTVDPFDAGDPATWIDVVNGRSSILFATLAGVSLALVTGGRTPLGGSRRARASARIAVRAGVLWLLGLALVATGVPVYVILPAYAILFLLSLPFLGLRPRTLFLLAAGVAVIMPFPQAVWDALPWWETPAGLGVAAVIGWDYPFPVWIAFVLAGMGVGRLDLRSARTAAILLAAGGALAAGGYALAAATGSTEAEERISLLAAVWTARPHSSGVLEVVGSGGFALAVIGACLLLCRTAARWVVLPVRAVGSMPLTAYTAQLIVWAIVSLIVFGRTDDLFAFRGLEPFWPMTVGLIAACTVWAFAVGRGPLEAGMARVSTWLVPERPGSRR